MSRVVGRLGSVHLVGVGLTLVAGCAAPPSPTPSGPAPASASAAPSARPSASPSPTVSVQPSTRRAVWLPAGELVEARDATHVVVLGTGDVLVVGSDYQTSWLTACGAATDGSDSVDIGDPGSGVWQATTSLPSRREAPAVVALRDGRALVTGGENGESKGNVAYSSTSVFDPADAAWTRSGLLNVARSDPAVALLPDGRVLAAGGRYNDLQSGQRLLDSSELWDPASGSWSTAGRLEDRRVGASAVTLADGRVLVVGGVASPESAPVEQASAEIFDPRTERWRTAGQLITARSGFVLVALDDGGAIAAGGFGSLGTSQASRLATVERFDPSSNTWSLTGDLPEAVAGATGLRLADGRVLVAGGSARDPEATDDSGAYLSGLTAGAALFDPATGAWASTTSMPSARAGASAVLLDDGSALLAGGSASEGEMSTPGCPVAAAEVLRYVPRA